MKTQSTYKNSKVITDLPISQLIQKPTGKTFTEVKTSICLILSTAFEKLMYTNIYNLQIYSIFRFD